MRLNFIFFGPPGSGKGTQASIISEKYNFKHISTGDIFRQHIKDNTKLGKLVINYINEGNLVPYELTLEILRIELGKLDRYKGVIFDGFPRNLNQAIGFDNLLTKIKDSICIFFDFYLSDEYVMDRLKSRAIKESRADDINIGAIKNRLSEYKSNRNELRDYYIKAGKYKKVEALGSINVISDLISCDIDKFL